MNTVTKIMKKQLKDKRTMHEETLNSNTWNMREFISRYKTGHGAIQLIQPKKTAIWSGETIQNYVEYVSVWERERKYLVLLDELKRTQNIK